MNRVLYMALDCEDTCYGGCSGTGESRVFTPPELKSALEFVRGNDFDGLARPPNIADGLAEALAAGTGHEVVTPGTGEVDAGPEDDFLSKCVAANGPVEIKFL
jgi:hypothetical protein